MRSVEKTTDDRVLKVSRVINASPERLFDAWIKPEVMLRWWGPENAGVGEHELDIRVGGSWRTQFVCSMGGDLTCSGIYHALERPRRIACTWAWTQADGSRGHETLVDVSFEEVERGTRLTVVQQTFQNAEQRDLHGQGWT